MMNAHIREFAIDDQPRAGGIVPRATAERIVRQRNEALKLYEASHQAMTIAHEAVVKAHAATRAINPRETRYTHHLHGEKVKFMHIDDAQERDDFMKHARKITDTEAWSHIIEVTDLERLMDKKAKDELYQALLTDPPEVTLDNIYATLDGFALNADMIFKRGIANAFSKLDRKFRSHDGFKIGSRAILTGMFDGMGFYNYHRDMESTMMDIERTFLVLDGKSPSTYAGIIGILRNARSRGRCEAHQTEVENEYFLVRCYKNGNCHLWFKRDDLVERVNKLLAEYYGEVIPDGMTPEDDGGLYTPKTTLAKHYGFYPTPDKAGDEVIDKVSLYRNRAQPPLTILEPSAGTGNLARRCAEVQTGSDGAWGEKPTEYTYRAIVDCVEIQPALADMLRGDGLYRKVYGCDFLQLKPETTGLYDVVAMNPPFDRERDIDHVMHALEFLKPDGKLVAIMSAGTEFRDTRKAIAFRDLMTKMHARFNDLPAGSFSSVGTNINTVVLQVYKDGRNFYR
jgi:hypothetical protein